MAQEKKDGKLGKGRHLSALKRQRQNERRRLRNRTARSAMRTAVKTFRAQPTREALAKVIPFLDKAASKGIIPKQRASRLASRLSRLVNKTAAA